MIIIEKWWFKMYFLSIFLFAVFSNLDNLIIGFSYGIKKTHISVASSFLVAVITLIGTVVSMIFGRGIVVYIPVKVSNAIGSIIVIGIGSIGLIKYLQSRKQSQAFQEQWPVNSSEEYDINNNDPMEYHEIFSLGLALSINNMGLGIGASISGLHILPTAIMSFLFSVVFISAGNFLGGYFISKIIGKYAEAIAAIGIIILGICEWFFN